ncbi:hypothetical protein B9T33_04790 [Acinetobacter sp. ANC 5054]|nr:hypothetical protein B9T33_04790 [Acinetobacter sp. ANC 5054]
MFNNFALRCLGLFLIFSVSSPSFAASIKKDPLNNLIEQISTQASYSVNKTLNRSLLGRASWYIQCEFQAQENSKMCLMQKNQITVILLNDDYSINVGSDHVKNSISVLRVDQNHVLQTREGLYRDARNIIDQFRNGLIVKTRYESNLYEAP